MSARLQREASPVLYFHRHSNVDFDGCLYRTFERTQDPTSHFWYYEIEVNDRNGTSLYHVENGIRRNISRTTSYSRDATVEAINQAHMHHATFLTDNPL